MRTTKFRGKRLDTGEWVYGDYYQDQGDHFICFESHHYIIDPETKGEWTGLEDKNGKEIYEGDIVLTDEAGWVAEVVYKYDMFCCVKEGSGFSSMCDWSNFKVLGTIHDPNHEELMKP